jgi:hypothetical protein
MMISIMMKSLTKLIEACVEDINTNELTTFDVEYIFLQLRGKSSGEIIEVGYNVLIAKHQTMFKLI